MSNYTEEDAKWAKQVTTCREIVKTINEFGVTDFQKIKIIELLGLELENREDSITVIETVRRLLEKNESENSNQRRILT